MVAGGDPAALIDLFNIYAALAIIAVNIHQRNVGNRVREDVALFTGLQRESKIDLKQSEFFDQHLSVFRTQRHHQVGILLIKIGNDPGHQAQAKAGQAAKGYPDYLLYAGLPMSAVTLLTGWFMAGRIQKMTAGKMQYHAAACAQPREDENPGESRRRRLSALAFAATIIVMAIVGVIIKAGFSFAIIVMLLVALITGLVGGLRPTQILQALYKGCGRLVWMFILYWLYNPILELMDGLHAYQGLLDYTRPLLEGISPAWLCFSIFAFNIIGHVPGAAVAQMTFTHKIFGPMLMAAGVPPQGLTAVLLASSQVDWFGPFPSSDMFGQMGLAQSTQLKYMLYSGWAIVIANIVLFAVLFHLLMSL